MKPTSESDRQTSRTRSDERVHAHVDEAVRAAVVVRDAERDRRPDERLELGSGPLRHLERDVDVGPERAVVAVVLGRADGDDHRAPAPLQVLAHLEVRHLGHEDRAAPSAILREPEAVQVLVRAPHALVDVGERRPRLARRTRSRPSRGPCSRRRAGSRARGRSRRCRRRSPGSSRRPCRRPCPSGGRGRGRA